MIRVAKDFTRPDTAESHSFSGPLIDFLQREFPAGFGEASAIITVNGIELDVEDYDVDLELYDEVIILLMPGANFAWAAFFKQVLIHIAVAAITYYFTPKPRTRKADKPGTYFEINSEQNVPRLGQPIPVQYGKVTSYPAVASQPYTVVDAAKNIQYLHQILCLGHGSFDITNVRLGTTPLSAFPAGDVSFYEVPYSVHQGKLGIIKSLYGVDEDVHTSFEVQGVDLTAGGQLAWFGKLNSTWIVGKNEMPSWWVDGVSAYTVRTSDGVKTYKMNANVEKANKRLMLVAGFDSPPSLPGDGWYEVILNADDDGWRGWFAASMPYTKTSKLEVEFTFPNGLVKFDTEGDQNSKTISIAVEYMPIDDEGVPLGPAVASKSTISRRQSQLFTHTITLNVPSARYQVRVRRDTRADQKQTESSSCLWTALRGFVDHAANTPAYGKVTLLVFKIKATARTSEAARQKIRVTATRKLNTILTDLASFAPTVNPIDAVIDIMKAEYGAGLDDSYLDLPALKAFATAVQKTNGFNYIFETQKTIWDALQLALMAHRSAPLAYNKKLSVQSLTVSPVSKTMFSRENYLPDTFSIDYELTPPKDYDGVKVIYSDSVTWDDRSVLWPANSVRPETIEAVGISYQAHALAHAKWVWEAMSKVRRSITFSTELDASLLTIGDRFEASMPMVSWHQSVRVKAILSSTRLSLDALIADGSYQLRARDEYGAVYGPFSATVAGGVLTLTAALPFTPRVAEQGIEATHLLLGSTAETISKSYIAHSISYSGLETSVVAREYIDTLYSAFPIPDDAVPPPPPAGPVTRTARMDIPALALGGAVVTRSVYQMPDGGVWNYNSAPGKTDNWGDWITPAHANIGASYQVKNTILTNAANFFNASAWNGIMRPLSVDQAMSYQQKTVGSSTGSVKCEIFDLAGTKLSEYTMYIPVTRTS